MRISDWSSDVCSSDLEGDGEGMMSNRAMDADFAVIPIRAAVPRPAREVWDLIGGFFDLDKWLDVECAPVAGSGETGSIRIINGAVEIGKAACRERVWQYGSIWVVAVSLKKKKLTK